MLETVQDTDIQERPPFPDEAEASSFMSLHESMTPGDLIITVGTTGCKGEDTMNDCCSFAAFRLQLTPLEQYARSNPAFKVAVS